MYNRYNPTGVLRRETTWAGHSGKDSPKTYNTGLEVNPRFVLSKVRWMEKEDRGQHSTARQVLTCREEMPLVR